jgi:hypothetical protein
MKGPARPIPSYQFPITKTPGPPNNPDNHCIVEGVYGFGAEKSYHPLEATLVGTPAAGGWQQDVATVLGVDAQWVSGFLGGFAQGPAPRLAIITGVGSVAVDDIRAQLREAEADLALDVVRVSMHRPADVARAIRQAADVQAVALTRGGGSDVHELDAEELIAAVASSPRCRCRCW